MDGPTEAFEFEGILEAQPQPQEPAKRLAFKAIHKREVCRYWLNNCCKKGDTCEFLHSFEQDKMPICRKGVACGDPSCFLTHSSKEEKPLCPNFAAGFCSFGYSCQWRHDVVEGPPPPVAIQFLANDPAKVWIAERRASQRSFRTAPCPYFHNDGWCPYFLSCAFSHELKTPPVPLSLTSFPPLPTRPQMATVHPVPVRVEPLPPIRTSHFARPPMSRPPSRRGPPGSFAPRAPSSFVPRGGRGGAWRRGGGGMRRGGPRVGDRAEDRGEPRLRLAPEDNQREWGDMAFE